MLALMLKVRDPVLEGFLSEDEDEDEDENENENEDVYEDGYEDEDGIY